MTCGLADAHNLGTAVECQLQLQDARLGAMSPFSSKLAATWGCCGRLPHTCVASLRGHFLPSTASPTKLCCSPPLFPGLQKHEKARQEHVNADEVDENFIRLYWEQMLQVSIY